MTGPPGIGKTMMARAIAGKANVPFFACSGIDFGSFNGAAKVRELFKKAQQHKPCVIFIDEFDAMMGLFMDDAMTQLLVELDGFKQTEGVVVIGATTKTRGLDPALTRPGRLKVVSLTLPNRKGRREILEFYAKNISLAADVSLSRLAGRTVGMTAAELMEILNMAAIRAGAAGAEMVTITDLDEAADTVVLGAANRILLTEVERNTTAYHEAGHALVGMKTAGAGQVRKVTIMPRGKSLGRTESGSDDEDEKHIFQLFELQARLDVCLGGRVAEEVFFGPNNITTGSSSDLDQARELAKKIVLLSGKDTETKHYSPAFESTRREVNLGSGTGWADHPSTLSKEVELRMQLVLVESYARVTELLKEQLMSSHAQVQHR
eukprot:gnl/TRDRNA2_/TRDRNA2_177279_c4_seq22.p1 gnl/TRDRNA2_/TRDRNA2_177279_c4~~gnl/TRDRNA2_/TRDRNA2_177279_c4_seq22.p1  ORF type:complete len:378 (-),score=42.18 gnl/TRDRNA2_/TRDRNA2_177279_c4_seq22:49-1182(-)